MTSVIIETNPNPISRMLFLPTLNAFDSTTFRSQGALKFELHRFMSRARAPGHALCPLVVRALFTRR